MIPQSKSPAATNLADTTPARLATLRKRLWDRPANSVVTLGDSGLRVRITDGPNAYMQYKDVFVRGIYRYRTDNPTPTIIDGGGNMGISVLGFKRDHPNANVTVFEPDLAIGQLLRENLTRNNASDGVTIVPAGLAAEPGRVSFHTDASAGGQITAEGANASIDVVRLSDHVTSDVDFLKLNIEGQELPVLREMESAGKLVHVRRLVVEYHGWAGGEQCLGDLLNLLARNKFRYLVHDFDAETGPITKPPFRHRPKADWFCLVYGEQVAA